MIAAIEIGLGQLVVDPVVGFRGQHQATQHRLFGFHRVRRHAQLVDARFVAIAVEAIAALFAVGTEAGTGGHAAVFPAKVGQTSVGMRRPRRMDKPVDKPWTNRGYPPLCDVPVRPIGSHYRMGSEPVAAQRDPTPAERALTPAPQKRQSPLACTAISFRKRST